MKIFLKIFIFTLCFNAFGVCEFKKRYKSIVSLSGSSTVIFKELGLLKDLKGISVFNPITKDEYSGTVYPGGIFMSQSGLSSLDKGVVFFDESRELRKILQSRKTIIASEIKTRNQTPLESIKQTLSILKNYIQGCDKEISKVLHKTDTLQKEITSLIKEKPYIVFFLGELSSERLPDLVMVNDGFVKWMMDNNMIKTYPSELAYVNWSAKLLHAMPKSTLYVGIKDSGRDYVKKIKRFDGRYSLIYPGALVPGLTQLEGVKYLFENLK